MRALERAKDIIKGYHLSTFKHDVLAGLIVAALTIPVAMGYAGVAGLPPIYGLYASILPVLGYAVLASSRRLIFGMDASASALTGSFLAAMGFAAGSQDAVGAAAVLSFFTAVFLFAFAALRLGRFAEYISMPVMSGFISGTALSILIGQLPKLMGIPSEGGSALETLGSLFAQLGSVNWPSLLIGVITIALLLIGRRFFSRFPTVLAVMALGTLCTFLFGLDQYGVSIVGEIPGGLPPLQFPNLLHTSSLSSYIGVGLVMAIVIFADSLMSANSFAQRDGVTLNSNREIAAFGLSNLMASLSGCSPTSSSVSRTAASEEFNGKTKMVSLVAVVVVVLVVAFLDGALYYMPQPMLGGIVFGALLSVVDVKVIKNLLRFNRREAIIWIVSALGVLVVGVLFGVLIGVVLSFIDVIIRMSRPKEAFLGRVPGRRGFFDLSRHKDAVPLHATVIYRFSARLFFGNVTTFCDSIKKVVKAQRAQTLIIDASGINNIDATAADALLQLFEELDKAGVVWRIAGQIEPVNIQMRKLRLPVDGHITKTIEEALEGPRDKKPAEPSGAGQESTEASTPDNEK